MAKNERQRRPLQDETRSNKKTVRERAQISRRQRDRIEENRDRREQRRERQRNRRQIVDSIRSPKEDVRIERLDSRLIPVEDTFLGRPVGTPKELPVVIGERASDTSLALSSGVALQTLVFDTVDFSTERNGYPSIYSTTTGAWTIPAGLGGVYLATIIISFPTNSTGQRTIDVKVNTVQVAELEMPAETGIATVGSLATTYLLQEGDTVEFGGQQNSGGSLNIDGHASLIFLGK